MATFSLASSHPLTSAPVSTCQFAGLARNLSRAASSDRRPAAGRAAMRHVQQGRQRPSDGDTFAVLSTDSAQPLRIGVLRMRVDVRREAIK